MITIRTGSYSKEDINFLVSVFEDGMKKNCYNIEAKGNNYVCNSCRNRTACNEALSALHHLLSVYYRQESKANSEK